MRCAPPLPVAGIGPCNHPGTFGGGLLGRGGHGALGRFDGLGRCFGEGERVALLAQAIQRGLLTRLRRAGNGLVGEFLGKLRCRRPVSAPEREPGQRDLCITEPMGPWQDPAAGRSSAGHVRRPQPQEQKIHHDLAG